MPIEATPHRMVAKLKFSRLPLIAYAPLQLLGINNFWCCYEPSLINHYHFAISHCKKKHIGMSMYTETPVDQQRSMWEFLMFPTQRGRCLLSLSWCSTDRMQPMLLLLALGVLVAPTRSEARLLSDGAAVCFEQFVRLVRRMNQKATISKQLSWLLLVYTDYTGWSIW